MAIDLGVKTKITTSQDRAYHIEIIREFGKDPHFMCKREIITFDETNALLDRNRNVPSVFRNLSDIATKSITVGSVTLTGAKIAVIIEALFDALRQEDMA